MALQEFLWSLIVIYLAARIVGELAVRIGQPAVLGELLAGVLVGGSVLGWVEQTDVLTLLGQIGIMLLLFEVGLGSDLRSFLDLGWPVVAVAAIGTLAPFLLGYTLAIALDMSQLQAVFIGAALIPTSVAIPVRVLHDLGKLDTASGRIILGAAILDDLFALIALSVLIGLSESGAVSWVETGRTALFAILFVGLAVAVGIRYAHLFTGLVNRMSARGGAVIAALTYALILGYAADAVHIAPLIGTFAAGLGLARTEHQARIEERIKPVADVFVPIFFVMTGAAVDLSYFNPLNPQNEQVLFLAAGLTVAAVVGKLVSGLGAVGRHVNGWGIGVGMVPRGEFVMIFASMGLAHHIIPSGEYGAILIVTVLTTLASPVVMKLLFQGTPSGSWNGTGRPAKENR